ncbi:Uma2 family endonuclease [Leptolyngbya sp. AN02str]|uniref:Uma2 family endonuclease n=1 Tax=Leptolyngbya sp. AN02str TaxID=3423363 RepID=UPI003D322864
MQTQSRLYTPEDYLAQEETAEFRSEYHDGAIVPMTGGSINHNRIVRNLLAYLTIARKGRGFEPFGSDLRLWIPQHRRFTYPDGMVILGQPELYGDRTDTVLNPSLIVEVLSRCMQSYDQSEKFRCYRSIPTLQEYVLINQYVPAVDQYTRTEDGLWLLRAHDTVEGAIAFRSIDAELAIADLYDGVEFEPEADGTTLLNT